MKDNITRLITHFFTKAKQEQSFCLNWELFKFESSKYLRKFGSNLAKIRASEEQNIISKISLLTQMSPDLLTEENKIELSNLQENLDGVYRGRAAGAFIRSQRQWLEEGEQNSAYVFNLEKYRAKLNTINELRINDTITDDPKLISEFCATFYKALYKTNYSECDALNFLDSLQNIPKLSVSEKDACDFPLSLTEVKNCINGLKDNNSPGTDGLSSEFYKLFSLELAPFLLQVFNESLSANILPWSMTQGLITLIPKPNKNLLLIDN